MTDFFSPDYFAARERFRSGVLATAGQIESILLDAKGPAGEDLTIDIGWFGSPEPRRAFVHSSGLRGLEGFAGSAIQLQWLEQGLPELAPDAAIALVHVMNPWGMAWLRRVNENNADLTHNFLAADEEYQGAPPRLIWRFLRRGMSAIRQATSEGQYEFPRGLCYGGKRHEQSARRFQIYISGKLANAERIVAVDIHTGLHGASQSGLGGLYLRMFPAAQVHFSVQQFGSCGPLTLLAALRAENRQHHSGPPTLDHPAKLRLREVLCPSNERWRENVLAGGKAAIEQALSVAFDSAAANGVTAD